MVDIVMKVQWDFIANAEETALILAALGSRLKPEQREAAEKLGDQLAAIRFQSAKHFHEQMKKHYDNSLLKGD